MKRFFAVSLLISVLLLSALTLVPVSVEDIEKVGLNDRLAAETTGAEGTIKFKDIQKGVFMEISKIKVKSLLPNHDYEIWVTVSPPGLPEENVISSQQFGPFTTNDDGKLKVKKLQVTVPGTGTWRLDVFVTRTHTTDEMGAGEPGGLGKRIADLLDRDPLLACIPALIITSVQPHEKRVLLSELFEAREATAKYLDVSMAIADGYVPVSPPVPGMGVHYLRFLPIPPVPDVDPVFEATRPEILLYSLTGDGPKLVAVEYAVAGPEPSGFAGRSDVWDLHLASCHYADEFEIEEPDSSSCPTTSPDGAPLVLWHPDLWTLHVWMWLWNPDGIFEPFNPNVA